MKEICVVWNDGIVYGIVILDFEFESFCFVVWRWCWSNWRVFMVFDEVIFLEFDSLVIC